MPFSFLFFNVDMRCLRSGPLRRIWPLMLLFQTRIPIIVVVPPNLSIFVFKKKLWAKLISGLNQCTCVGINLVQ